MVSNARAGMGVGVLFGLTLSALLTLMVTASAQAQTAGSCQQEFTVLRTHTESVLITGGKVDKERAGLVKVVDDGETLASIGKTSDAATKLGGFTVKVDQLEAAGRIDAESADRLRSDAQATIVCLQGTGTATTVAAVN